MLLPSGYNIEQFRQMYKKFIKNCTSELKENFPETIPFRLFEFEMKIKKLEIKNDDFKL